MRNREEARRRANALVAEMTLEERASQLRYNAPAIPRLGIPAYNWWNEALHGVARAGTATVFPQAIGLAATFDDALVETIADVVATEGRAKYNAQSALGDRDIYKGLTFWSPNINIFRDPRWGRGHETYGEDPCLTAKMGIAFVRGLQGKGKYLKSAACAKHIAVHSGPEGTRHGFNAEVNQKDLFETYLPAFEALVKEADVEAVMGAYNAVNGEPACGSKTLIQDILRGMWGFEGHFVSDCGAVQDFWEFHKFVDTPTEAAALALENGCDLNCGSTYAHMMRAYHEGLVTEEQITLSAERVMTTRFLLGMFDDDCEYDTIPFTANDTDESDDLARVAAEKSMVLLKNDGILPLSLDKIRTVAVVGPNADSIPVLEGNYCGTSSRYVTFLEGVQDACKGKARVLYAKGCHLYKDRETGLAQADDRLAEAIACAHSADVVIACVGLDATLEGEQGDAGNEFSSGDKMDLELPAPQRKLLDRLVATGKPVVVVACAGSAIRVEEGNAILHAWYPGQAGGTAAANILFGKVSPSGKLPLTFYRSVDDLPDFEDYAMKNRTYRYFEGTPVYPFGYGLTYGKANVSGLQVKKTGESDAYSASVEVKNDGDVPIEEVIQLYLQNLDSEWAPRHPVLVGFQRVSLMPGEDKAVSISIPAKGFTVVNDTGNRVHDGKRFAVFMGTQQPDYRSTELTGNVCLKANITIT